MTKEQFAERLNGREMGSEIDFIESKEAKSLGLVILFGYSDDSAEFRGAIHDEIYVYDGGGDIFVYQEGIVVMLKSVSLKDHQLAKIEAVRDSEGYYWTYKADIPHATFDILEFGEKYCRGIVFNLSDLPKI